MSIPFHSAARHIRGVVTDYRSSKYFVPGTVVAAVVVLGVLLRKRVVGKPYYASEEERRRVSEKVVIVTGASGGLGEEVAKALVDMNAHVILACRDEAKTQLAIARIRAKTTKGKLTYLPLDLGDLDSVRDFAAEFMELGLPLHILVLNAGAVDAPYQKTKSGHEIHFGTNHLGHYLLTNLLLNKLIAAKGRVVGVSSGLYRLGRINFDDLNFAKTPFSSRAAYANSKLANILFINELQNTVKGTGVDAFSVTPGLVKTEAGRHYKGLGRFFLNVLYVLIGKTPEQGAQTLIYAAISSNLTGHGGAYLENCKEVSLTRHASDPIAAKKLWDVSSRMVGLTGDFLTRQPSQKVLHTPRK